MTPSPLRLQELIARLTEADVQFVLVGGLAVNAWGYMRATQDVDVVPDPAPQNLERLEAVLLGLGGRVDVNGRLLEGSAIHTFLRAGDRTLVATDLGQVDVLQGLPQIPSFATLDGEAKEIQVEGLVFKVCSLEHLLEMKRSSDRPRDQEDLKALEDAQNPGEDGE